jgi:hypothetical protein
VANVISFTDYTPSPRFDEQPWTHARIEGSTVASGTWMAIETIALDPVDDDPTAPASRSFTTEDADASFTWFRIVFVDADGDEQPTMPVPYQARYATVGDIAARLGRDLTEGEEQTASLLLESVSGLIAEAAGESPGYVPDPMPSVVRLLAIEKVIGVLNNPHGFASFTKQLGAFTQSGTFPRASDIGVFLSEDERRRVRRALGSSGFASSTLASPYSEGASNVLDFELTDL